MLKWRSSSFTLLALNGSSSISSRQGFCFRVAFTAIADTSHLAQPATLHVRSLLNVITSRTLNSFTGLQNAIPCKHRRLHLPVWYVCQCVVISYICT
jgi:hypothetical protein